MKRYFNLYSHFIRMSLSYSMTYRADFFAWSMVSLGWFIATILFYQLLFGRLDAIAGWTKGQVFILQGFYYLLEGVIWGLFFSNLEQLPRKINQGKLDLELAKPINTQFLISFKSINFDQITSIFLGLAAIFYGLRLENLTPTITEIIFALVLFIIASVFFYSGWFITTITAFWFDRLENVIFFFSNLREFARFPLPAYQGITRFILSLVIPLSLITTLPSQALFSKPSLILVASLTINSALWLTASHYLFQFALRRYSSASS